jgi:hypothetical protein
VIVIAAVSIYVVDVGGWLTTGRLIAVVPALLGYTCACAPGIAGEDAPSDAVPVTGQAITAGCALPWHSAIRRPYRQAHVPD